MDYRTLEITVQYAKDLNKVNFIFKMDVYVVVSISGGDKNSKQETKTSVDRDGDADPTWRFPMKFLVEEAALRQNRLTLDFNLKSARALGDKDIGEVHVAIKDLIDAQLNSDGGSKRFVSYQVTKPNGKPKGQLTFSYRFAPPPLTEVVYGESPCRPAAAGANYPLLLPPPLAEVAYGESPCRPAAAGANYPVLLPPPPSEEFGGQYLPPAAANYPVLPSPAAWESTEGFGGQHLPPWCGYPPDPPPQPWCRYPPEPPASGGLYPPHNSYGYPPQHSYGYPPAQTDNVYPPQRYHDYPPPMMQLAPNWWIVDWRYEVHSRPRV